MIDLFQFLGCEIRGDAIGTVGAAIKGNAVPVHQAEVAPVMKVGGAQLFKTTLSAEKIQRYTQSFGYLSLSLFNTFVKRLFSRSIISPRVCAMFSSFRFAFDAGTAAPEPDEKHPAGLLIMIS